ncbi:MAG: S-(hydroxymethyl)glutathione dehydrogenase / alcohol dehydrogenase [Solirubrobacteraceae bacterium]|jgi:S-(hydroxymethyl)glutathione dehydrogenase/alcohol dehydrogenase|nr:S-(hydroxymethyl)glutathione dehydrogenase / alcohol dehydrogenase [Solirubrobacteraceae bacterium]MEA2358647.1 S-(hydroxymethyl)glutathione dehydrogenase / alcohol dehydrogenase [Solirubrobacteraceae bacterium]
MRSRAAVLYEWGAPLEIREIDVAEPRQGEVAVRVKVAGLCHSDLSVMEGKIPQELPFVPGHEAVGRIEAVGPGVTGVAVGDVVLMVYRAACGTCRYCARGRPALCAMAVQIRGTGRLLDGTTRYHDGERDLHHFSGVSAFSEIIVVPASAAIKVDDDLPLEAVAVIGCAVLTGFGAVVNAADVQPGESAVVVGTGGVGLNVVQGCRVSGANPIIAVDTAEEKLAMAREFGATHAILATEEDVAARVHEITGDGADYVFEAVGAPSLVEMGLTAVRRGGTVVVIGAPAASAQFAVNQLALLSQEKVIKGSLYGSSNFWRDVPTIIALWRAGKLDIDRLVQNRYRLDDINQGFHDLHGGQLGRSIVEMS